MSLIKLSKLFFQLPQLVDAGDGSGNTDASAHVSSTQSESPCRCTYRSKKNHVTNRAAVSYSSSTPKCVYQDVKLFNIRAELRGDFDCVLSLDPYFHFVSICGGRGAIEKEENFCSLDVF